MNPGPTAPIPPDPHEIATGPTRVALRLAERDSILGLVERAHNTSDLTISGSPAFTLEVSFDASGQPPDAGSGKMEETWLDPRHWRWSAQIGNYSQTRLHLDGDTYDENATDPVPLRIQMVHNTIFWPTSGGTNVLVRTTQASWDGKDVTCVLVSNGGSKESTPGRRWVETERCIDPQSGLLAIYSPEPGIYYVYDYKNPLKFHGRMLARQVKVYENGTVALLVRVERIREVTPRDSNGLVVTNQMMTNGPRMVEDNPVRLEKSVSAPPGAANSTIQPVIVHAMMGAGGKVSDVETLQTPDPVLVQKAIELAKDLLPVSLEPTAPIYHREFFLNLEFDPAGRQPEVSPTGPRDVRLIHPNDPEFDSLLDAAFPGMRDRDGFAPIKPFVALVQNLSGHGIKAFAIRWVIVDASGNSSERNLTPIASGPPYTLEGEDVVWKAGETRLVSPYFNWTTSTFRSQNGARLLSESGNGRMGREVAAARSIDITLDAVIYDDYVLSGPDHSKFSVRYECDRNGAIDEAALVVSLLDSNASDDEIAARLNADSNKGMAGLDRDMDRTKWLDFARGNKASELLDVLRSAGRANLKAVSLRVASYKRTVLQRQ